MSSPKFLDLIKPAVGDDAATNFQRMMYAQTLAYHQSTSAGGQYVLNMQQIGSMARHHWLAILDQKLIPQSLANGSKDDLQALFLLIIGIILAVGYTKPVCDFPLFPRDQVRVLLNK
jgi:hypothetical protein